MIDPDTYREAEVLPPAKGPDLERFERDFRRIASRAKVRAGFILIGQAADGSMRVSIGGENTAAEVLGDMLLRSQLHRMATGANARWTWEGLKLRALAFLAGMRVRLHRKVGP